MNDAKNIVYPAIEKLLEFTIRTILRSTQGKAAVIVVIHENATAQSSASVAPGSEKQIATALRKMADKIETHEGARVEMSEQTKN